MRAFGAMEVLILLDYEQEHKLLKGYLSIARNCKFLQSAPSLSTKLFA